MFTGVVPAASKDAIKKMSGKVKSWRLHTLTGHTMDEIAHAVNPVIRGWMQYYGAFYKTDLYPLLSRISAYLVRWIRKKYRRPKTFAKAHEAWKRTTLQYLRFSRTGSGFTVPGEKDEKSPVTRECHAGITPPSLPLREPGEAIPRATHLRTSPATIGDREI